MSCWKACTKPLSFPGKDHSDLYLTALPKDTHCGTSCPWFSMKGINGAWTAPFLLKMLNQCKYIFYSVQYFNSAYTYLSTLRPEPIVPPQWALLYWELSSLGRLQPASMGWDFVGNCPPTKPKLWFLTFTNRFVQIIDSAVKQLNESKPSKNPTFRSVRNNIFQLSLLKRNKSHRPCSEERALFHPKCFISGTCNRKKPPQAHKGNKRLDSPQLLSFPFYPLTQ